MDSFRIYNLIKTYKLNNKKNFFRFYDKNEKYNYLLYKKHKYILNEKYLKTILDKIYIWNLIMMKNYIIIC
jgi:hypothetical protein